MKMRTYPIAPRWMPAVVFVVWVLPSILVVRTTAAPPGPGGAAAGDIRSFELKPVAPPTPALKYRLRFDPLDRHPGNAAIPYMQATMFLKDDVNQAIDQASDALSMNDEATFRASAAQVVADSKSVVDELDLAGRCESCDWQPPIRERGIQALLPHLNHLRQMANILRLRAVLQARDGNTDDALATIRLSYEMARNTGREPVLVSGLVAVGIGAISNESLVEVMNRPESPNLYWALASLPRPMMQFSHSMSGERTFLVTSLPALAKWRDGKELSAQDWRDVLQGLIPLLAMGGGDNAPKFPADIEVAASVVRALPEARKHYAQTRNVPPEQVEKIEAIKVVGTYYFDQYMAITDDYFKAVELPYPQLQQNMTAVSDRVMKEKKASPGNLFLMMVPSLNRAATSFARFDRQLAALTAVEALRSYAAAHDGKFPEKLEDVTETPVPVNPMTCKPFEYRLEDDKASLRDSEMKDYVLNYSVRIRK